MSGAATRPDPGQAPGRAPAARPLPLPALPRRALRRVQLLGLYRAPLPLPGAQGFALEIGRTKDATPPSDLVQVDATLDGAPFGMTAPRNLAHELVQALGASIALDGMPEDLAGVLLEASVASLLTMLEQAVGGAIALRAFRDLAAPARGRPLVLHGPERKWQLHLAGAPETIDRFLLAWPPARREAAWLTLPARMRLGLTVLDLGMVRSLRPGDVVLPETALPDASAFMLVVAESVCAPATLRDGAVQLAAAPGREREDWLMSGQQEAEGANEEDLDAMPVRLAFDLGQMDVPLGALRQMDAGTVLELGKKAQNFVDISANGKRIGRGELVDIDGSVGVRITSMRAG